jgi:putative peptidoglycan lipid II flippase
LRVLAVVYVLGVGTLSDAYNYANGIPNIVYDLLLGGVLSATLIPVFVEHLRHDDERERVRAISAVLTAVAVALVAISGLLWLVSPWLIRFYLLLYPKSAGGPERSLATTLLRYFAPQVFFLGAIVVTTALLNARRSFTAAAVSPVINNLIAIGALLATKFVAHAVLTNKSASPVATVQSFAHDQHAVWVLGIGTTLGYAVQFLVQIPAMGRAGIRVRPVWDLHHPAVRRVARLSSWLVGVVVANQASLALVMVLAGKQKGFGGVTAYQFSYQFFQLPYALVAVSIASALMPDLAERWTSGDRRAFERQLVIGLRVTLAVLVPAGLAYVAVAQPLIQLAVHHGRVSQQGAHLVSSTLALFAVGLPGFSAFFLLMRAYQAMQDARTMFMIYVLENGLTVVAALILDPIVGVPGLALAWVAPYTIASLVAVVDLRRRVGQLGGRGSVWAMARIFVAGGVAAGAVVLLGVPWPSPSGDAVLVARLVVQLGGGTAVYLVLARWFGIKELRPVARLLGRPLIRM